VVEEDVRGVRVGLLENLLVPIVTLVLGYFVGTWRTKQQRIIEERAKVLSGLFKRYLDLEQRVNSLVEPDVLSGEPGRETKYSNVVKSFNDLKEHHLHNTIWLSRLTTQRVDHVLERYREYVKPFGPSREEELGRTDTAEEWLDVRDSFQKESPKLRAALEEDFRAALGNDRMKLWGRRRRQREPSKLLREPVVKSPQSHENRQ
jgi:hypothetical protein